MIVKTRPLLTLETKLQDVPRWWLQYVEPRIKRVGLCWLWEGAHNSDGEPVIALKNLESGKYNTRMLKRIVAALFYELKQHYEIIHECGNLSCLNPGHLHVTALHWRQEDREKMVNDKAKNIRDYETRKKG